MFCYKCLNEVQGGVNGLFNHLKYVHGVHAGTSTFVVCRQDGCMSTFQYVSSYRRHILAVHAADTATGVVQEHEVDVDHSDVESTPMSEDEPDSEQDGQNCVDIYEAISFFIANMKASAVPSSTIQTVIQDVEELITVVVSRLHETFKVAAKEVQRGMPVNEADITKLENVFDEAEIIHKAFDDMGSQYKQEKYFKEKGFLISPEVKVLGQSFVTQNDNSTGGVHQKVQKDTFQYVPVSKTLKKHLEQAGVMTAILNEHPCDDVSLLETYRDGSYFKDKYSTSKDIVIPLLLYCDDFETGNPLGSKRGVNKLTGFYVSVLCLPAQFQAVLSNILLAACAKRNKCSQVWD